MKIICIELNCSNEVLEDEIQEIITEYLTQKNIKGDCTVRDNTYISLRSREKRGVLRTIRQENILFIEKACHKCIIHTLNGIYESYISLKEINLLLDPNRFFRVHQGYIVNVSKIKDLYATDLSLQHTDRIIPVSRRNRYYLSSHIYRNN